MSCGNCGPGMTCIRCAPPTPLGSATAGLALPLRAINVSSPDGWDFGWCAVDANNRIIGYCMNETQAKQLVAPFVVQSETGEWFDLDKCKPADKAMVRVRTFSGTETDARYWDGDFECECVLMPRWITGNKVFRWRAR